MTTLSRLIVKNKYVRTVYKQIVNKVHFCKPIEIKVLWIKYILVPVNFCSDTWEVRWYLFLIVYSVYTCNKLSVTRTTITKSHKSN